MRKSGFRLAVLATLVAVVVVLLGAYTRLTHAGLGCPDWPGCYGFLSVPMSEHKQALAHMRFPEAPVEVAKGWNEMIHRYVAGALGLLILALAIHALRRRKIPDQPLLLPGLLLLVVVVQAAFGMWTVTLKLWPQVVTLHLLGGFCTLALLFLLSLRLAGYGESLNPAPRFLQPAAVAALVLVVLQISLGGWVSSNYAAVACTDFPTCHGQWWPETDFANGFHITQHIGPNYLGGQLFSEARTAIHLAHRIGALVLSIALLLLSTALWRAQLKRLALLLLAALAAQIALGISNVLLHLPLAVAVAHNAGGAALLLTLVLINFHLHKAKRCAPAAASHDVFTPTAARVWS